MDSLLHCRAILEMLELDINDNLIEHLVQTTINTVAFACGSPSSNVHSLSKRSKKYLEFKHFVSNVVSKSEVSIGVLLVALVYIYRAKPHLHVESRDWACHRLFLGVLIVAAKYTSDSTLKNVRWSVVTGVFGTGDIARVEREFLNVVDWDLRVTDADILVHYDSIIALHSPFLRK